MQVFTVTGLFAGQHNTKLHGTITGVIIFFLSGDTFINEKEMNDYNLPIIILQWVNI